MNLTRITNPHTALTVNRFAPYAPALSLIIRLTNPSTASALIQALTHVQTYSLSIVPPVASFPNARPVFTRSKFRPKSTQPLRSHLMPLRAPRRVHKPCAAPNNAPVNSFYHSNFNHPSNAWQLNFLEACLSYSLLGSAKVEHFYAKIAHYTPSIAKKTVSERPDKPQRSTGLHASPALRLKLFKAYIASKVGNGGLPLKSPIPAPLALRKIVRSESVRTSPYLFLGLRRIPSKVSISPIASMWALLHASPKPRTSIVPASRPSRTFKSAQDWRHKLQRLLKAGKLTWAGHIRAIFSKLTHVGSSSCHTTNPPRPLAGSQMGRFRRAQLQHFTYSHVVPSQPRLSRRTWPFNTGEAGLVLNPRGTNLRRSPLAKKPRFAKLLRACQRRARAISHLFRPTYRYNFFCRYYRANGARLPRRHLRSLMFLNAVWFHFPSCNRSVSLLQAPLRWGAKLSSAAWTRSSIQVSKAIGGSSYSRVKKLPRALKPQPNRHVRLRTSTVVPPVTASVNLARVEPAERLVTRPFESLTGRASLLTSLGLRLFNGVDLRRPKSTRPSYVTPLPTRLFYLLSSATPVLKEPACQYPAIRPNYSWRFLTSPFSFIHYIATASFPSHDVVRMSRSASDLPSYLVFPDTDAVKASVFRRLNRQKLILQSRSTIHNAYAAQRARQPKLPPLFRGAHIAASSLSSSLSTKLTPHLTTLSKHWIRNASIHVFKRDVTRNVTPRIRRIRFKPGYGRIWRAARSSIKEILNLRACYQYRLTPQLQRRYFQSRRTPINQLSFTLGFALMTSKFSVDHWTTSTLLNAHNVFLNGSSCSNPETRLFANDFIQLLVNLKFYIALRWLKGWSQLKRNRVSKIFYRKVRPGIPRINKTPKLSRNLPVTFFDLQYTYSDIPKYFEVDYFTLSIFVIHNQADLERSLPTRANLFNPLTLNMYNWKYIT